MERRERTTTRVSDFKPAAGQESCAGRDRNHERVGDEATRFPPPRLITILYDKSKVRNHSLECSILVVRY